MHMEPQKGERQNFGLKKYTTYVTKTHPTFLFGNQTILPPTDHEKELCMIVRGFTYGINPWFWFHPLKCFFTDFTDQFCRLFSNQ